VAAVLAEGSSSSSSSGAMDASVQRLLQHWQGAEVALAASRRKWLDSRENGAYIANFKQQADR
jgi:hypothetical protein